MRIAREKYLRLFGHIGTGDILQLAQAIEDERKELAEKAAKGEKEEPVGTSQSTVSMAESKGDMSVSESVTAAASPEKVEASADGEKVEAPPDAEMKATVEPAGEPEKPAASQDTEDDVKMEG